MDSYVSGKKYFEFTKQDFQVYILNVPVRKFTISHIFREKIFPGQNRTFKCVGSDNLISKKRF